MFIFKKKSMVSEDLLKESIQNTEKAIAEAQKYKHLYELAMDYKVDFYEEFRKVFMDSIDEVFDEYDYLHNDEARKIRTALLLRIARKCSEKISDNSIELSEET